MHIFSRTLEKIALVKVDTAIVVDKATRVMSVAAHVGRANAFNLSGLIARASRGIFEIGRQEGMRLSAPETLAGPPPVAFQESATGLLHVVYREVVIRFKHGTTQKARQLILKKRGFTVRRENRFVPDQVIVHHPSSKYDGEELVEYANEMAEMEEVAFAAPNFVSQFRRNAPPTVRAEEWHLRNRGTGGAKVDEDVNIAAAWRKTKGKRAIVVAVLDDGVDLNHPNLKARIWKNPVASALDKNGADFFMPIDHPDHFNPMPKRFQFPFDQMTGNDIHGTPCAGVVAAAGKAGGSVGAAPGCRILPVKIFHADDLAADEAVADAIRYAASRADILSCSWSGGFSPDIEAALDDAGTLGRGGRGSAVFCAAGNDGQPRVGYPARDPNAVAVGASTDKGTLAAYSNHGPEIAFVAPSSGGVRGIFTTDVATPNRGFNIGKVEQGGVDGLHTNSFGGTSSATPLVAGVAALVLSVKPALSRTDLRDLLARTADKIGTGYDARGHSKKFGFGRINAGKAVEEALGLP